MKHEYLHLDIQPQPDDSTCGPTCLHAVYRYFGDDLPLAQVIAETPVLEEGGTLAVLLGDHALRRGYQATIYTFNLHVFDPTWFSRPSETRPSKRKAPKARELIEKLQAQITAKPLPKLQAASRAYIEFLQLGGKIRMEELNTALLRRFLKRSLPILTGLSSTYLYQCSRELPDGTSEDVAGFPEGHFVVISGYDKGRKTVRVADPYLPNPLAGAHYYEVQLSRLICAILLGVLTYDANLLIIEPPRGHDRKPAAPGKEV